MQELTTTANLVEYSVLEDRGPLTAVLDRIELAEALDEDETTRLWFELGVEGSDETRRLMVDVTPSDLEELLRRTSGDEIVLALDVDVLEGMFEDPEVEAHGLRGALAIAIATAAVAAPSGLAAVPQTAGAAATGQSVGAAATSQSVGAAATSQQAGAAATTQVSSLAAKAQVSKVAAKGQVSSLVLKGASLKLLQAGLVR
jgi:hypothetical protein